MDSIDVEYYIKRLKEIGEEGVIKEMEGYAHAPKW